MDTKRLAKPAVSMMKIIFKRKPKKRDNYTRRLKTKKLIDYLESELRTSTTHGLPYIVNKNIHWSERVFWASCFVGSCIIIYFLLSSQYSRFVEAPIVMSVEKDYFNWNVSYPTIILCPAKKIDITILNKFGNDTDNTTNSKDLLFYYKAIASVTLETLKVDLPSLDVMELIKPEDYATVLKDIFKRLSNESISTFLQWPIHQDVTMTEMGMCHVFNSNVAIFDDPDKWKDENLKYVKKNIDLSVHDIDFFVQFLNYADIYQVYTMAPDEIIIHSTRAVEIEDSGFLSVGLRITSTRASKNVKNIPLHLRKCRFIYETNSNRYPVYSYNRCLIQCRIRMILKLCDCIPHFYKPLVGERVCSLRELECLLEYKKEIITLSITNDTMKKFGDADGLPKSSRDCDCLGNCEDDVFQNDHDALTPRGAENRLSIRVSSFPKMRVTRELMFSFYDLFLRSGGVVNLCIGSSVISIMELIMTALRIPIYEIMQVTKAIWRRYTRPQIQKMSLTKKQS